MDVLDFALTKGQQSFEEEKYINPIEIKIENNNIENMFDKCRKNKVRFSVEDLLFSSSKLTIPKKYFW